MKNVKIRIENDFHLSSVIVVAKLDSEGDGVISAGSAARADRVLCRVKGCVCRPRHENWYVDKTGEFIPDGFRSDGVSGGSERVYFDDWRKWQREWNSQFGQEQV